MKLPKLKTLFQIFSYINGLHPSFNFIRTIFSFLSIVLDLYAIKVGGQFLDSTARYITENKEFTFIGFLTSESFFYLALGLGIWLLSYSISQFKEYINDTLSKILVNKMKSLFFEKVAQLNLEDVESKDFRDRLTLSYHFGASKVWSIYKTSSEVLQSLFKGITSLVILYQYTGVWSLLIILFPLPEAIAGYMSKRKIRKFHDDEIETIKWSDYAENSITQIDSFPELKVDGTVHSLQREYDKRSQDFISKIIELVKHQYIDITFFSVLGKVSFTVYVAFVIFSAVIERLTIGTFKAIYDYALNVYNSFLIIFQSSSDISNQLDYAVKFFELKDYTGFGDNAHGDKELGKGTPVLKFKSLDFVYPDSKEKILENLNFEVQPGEKIMVLGGDGSGKSSFVKVLCGLYKIIAGDYEIGGYSIRELQRGELKKKLSVTFQEFINYNMTLQRNITISSNYKRLKPDLYEKALDISGVKKLMKKYNITNASMLGKYTAGGKDISPGFWQRIAIARMIYRNRDIFILDEPFTFIDDEEEKRILTELIKFAGKDKSIIFVTRDNRHKQFFDKIYRLEKGKLITH